ncbi:hypothetical protein JFK97_20320 [Chromobacterium phragmitis]|uniref:hypothetical protein n=2 Tax=Chromobacterium amazonense TaxID=1382803 RepID=UPI0021B847A4|nr:hypothetical protein [Chromobacterium amazonense]MBM2886739.1 hypothetical protein [Chromobacterium amazonense]
MLAPTKPTVPSMSSILLPDLTPDKGSWRLDWFGEVSYPPVHLRYAQPSVRILLSPITSELDDHETLNSTDATDLSRQRSVWVPIGSLPLLRIGSIWQEGQVILKPKYQHGTFINLDINPQTTSFIKAGLPLDDAYLIPLAEHPWHRKATQSYCLCVELPQEKRLLIPCLELIRFYFGSSSNLLGRLFKRPLQEPHLWQAKRFDTASQHLHLELAPYLSGASAADIGRIALDKNAWHSAAGIYSSCVKATSQQQQAYPYTHFPFCGRTTLMATGRWVSFAGKRDMSFVTYELLSCSHPFPFTSLSYEVDKPSTSRQKQKASDPPSQSPTSPAHSTRFSEEVALSQEGDPGRSKTPRAWPTFDKVKFPDLRKKPVWLEKLAQISGTILFARHADGSLEQVAFGDDTDDSNNRGMDVGEHVPPNEVALGETKLPGFVRAGIRLLQKKMMDGSGSSPHLVLLQMQGQPEAVFLLPLLVDEDGVVDSRVRWTAPDGRHRQRRACLIKGSHMPQAYVIIEGPALQTGPLVESVASYRIEDILAVLIAHQP